MEVQMRKMLGIAVFYVAMSLGETAVSPPSWKFCKVSGKDRGECLKEAAQIALAKLINGEKSLGVPPLDPMQMERTDIKDSGNPSSPFHFELTLVNYTVTGYKSMKFDNVQLDCDKLKLTLNVSASDEVGMKGRYIGVGKMLLVPVNGSGDFTFFFRNYGLGVVLSMRAVNKPDGKYFQVDSFSVSLAPPKARVRYGNLFRGNRLLEDKMNLVFNDNWDAIFKEMKSSLEDGFGGFVVANHIKPILEQIPANVLCPA